ncbi:FkbM family methyltransferase [Xanthobacter sp. KR7-225]|uniref:FkbM family methyltransferase n=1 Tax=Xanthobacter sp. KR7-225 TaxID=3156613 RepID=UPI0032B5C571
MVVARKLDQAVFTAEVERNLVSLFFDSRDGIFVEVGAFDPVFQSQTYHLEIVGWQGVLIEPEPSQAEHLRKSRRAPVFEVACAGPEVAGGFARLLSRRGLSSLRFHERNAEPGSVVDVKCLTLDQVLKDAGIERVDFLSIDVEGSEPDVLRGFDFARHRPKLILIDDRERFAETRRVMARNRYRLVRRTGHNSWFVPHDAGIRLSARGRFELMWTYGPGRLMRRTRSKFSERSVAP